MYFKNYFINILEHLFRVYILYCHLNTRRVGEFSKVIKTLDFVLGLNYCLKFSQPFSCEPSKRARYCSCHKNIKFISSSQRVMFFLLYGETNSKKAKGGNCNVIERYDTDKGDIRKIRHSGPGRSGTWNLRVV